MAVGSRFDGLGLGLGIGSGLSCCFLNNRSHASTPATLRGGATCRICAWLSVASENCCAVRTELPGLRGERRGRGGERERSPNPTAAVAAASAIRRVRASNCAQVTTLSRTCECAPPWCAICVRVANLPTLHTAAGVCPRLSLSRRLLASLSPPTPPLLPLAAYSSLSPLATYSAAVLSWCLVLLAPTRLSWQLGFLGCS